MSTDASTSPDMSDYEHEVWQRLQAHWEKRAKRRELPRWAQKATLKTSDAAKRASAKVGEKIPDRVREGAANAGGKIVDVALEPTIKSALHVL